MANGVDADADALGEESWVVWRLEVKDPQQLAGEGLDERTRQAMTELSGSLGCQYHQCVDYDSVDGTPEGTYYAWWVRVPRAEHQRRGPDGLPRAITTLQDQLRTVLPASLTDWHVAPDEDATARLVFDVSFKAVYADLIEPLELTLLGLRRDGAEALDPQTLTWACHDSTFGATYTLWLCKNPDYRNVGPCWLVVTAGFLAGDELWDTRLGKEMHRFGLRRDTPLLTIPRPEQTMWVVQAHTARLAPAGELYEADRVALAEEPGARHQWIGPDGHALATRMASDTRRLWPHLT